MNCLLYQLKITYPSRKIPYATMYVFASTPVSRKGSVVGRLLWENEIRELCVPKGPFRITA